jgi:hypothetical protein
MEIKMQHVKVNVDKVLAGINRSFVQATAGLGSNAKGTKLYQYQVDYCYIVNEINRGPSCMVQKYLSDLDDLIDDIRSQREANRQSE